MGKNSYIPSGKLEFINSDKQISFDTLEKKNNLYACLSVKTGIGVCTGWKKKVRMLLIWKIITSKGYTVKIKTDCISKDKYQDDAQDRTTPNWSLYGLNCQKKIETVSCKTCRNI